MALNLWRVVLRQGMRLIENHLTLKLSHNWPVIKELLAGDLKESRQPIDRLLCRADSYRYPRNLLLLRLVKKMFVAAFLFRRTPCPFPYPTLILIIILWESRVISLLRNVIARILIGLSRFPFFFPIHPARFLVAMGNANDERETSNFNESSWALILEASFSRQCHTCHIIDLAIWSLSSETRQVDKNGFIFSSC